MKIKKQLAILISVALTGLGTFTNIPNYNQNAKAAINKIKSSSGWHKGIPNFAKTDDKQWLSLEKYNGSDSYSKNGKKYYFRTWLLANGQVGTTTIAFYNNGKGNKDVINSGAPILVTPYYKKISNNIYQLKTTTSQTKIKSQMRFKKDGAKMKVWINSDTKHWKYLGTFEKAYFKSVYNTDPFK